MSTRSVVAFAVLAICAFVLPSQAAKTCTWTGGGDDNNWSTPENWGGTDASACPAKGDTVLLSNDVAQCCIINNDIVGLSLEKLRFVGVNPLTLTGEGVTVTADWTSFENAIQTGWSTNDVPMTFSGKAQELASQGDIVFTKPIALNYSSSYGRRSFYLRGTRAGGTAYTIILRGEVTSPGRDVAFTGHKTAATVAFHAPINVRSLIGDGGNSGAGGKVYLGATGSTIPQIEMSWNGYTCGAAEVLDENCIIKWSKYTETDKSTLNLNGFNQTVNYLSGNPSNNRYVSSAKAATFTMKATESSSSVCRFNGAVTVVYAPASSETTYTVSGVSSTTTGDLIISNGVFDVSGAATFANVKNVEVADGASLVFSGTAANPIGSGKAVLKLVDGALLTYQADGTLSVKELWVNGVRKDGGTYTHANLPQLADNGASITVPNWSRDPITFTWTGRGATPVWSDPDNWDAGDGLVPKGDIGDAVILSNDGTTPVIENDIEGLTLGGLTFKGSQTVTLEGLGIQLKDGATLSDSVTGSVVSTNRVPIAFLGAGTISFNSDIVFEGAITNLSSKYVGILARVQRKKAHFTAPVLLPRSAISLSNHISYGEIHFDDLVVAASISGDGGNHGGAAGLTYVHKAGSTFGTVNPRENGIHCQAADVFGETCRVQWQYYSGGSEDNKGIHLHGNDQVIDCPYSIDTEYGYSRYFVSDSPATLTMKATDSKWSNCGFNGKLSVTFAPADAATTYEARNSASTMTGTLTVSNGTFKISGTSTFAKAGAIDIWEGAALVVDSTAENPLGTQQVVLKLATDSSITLPADSTVSVKELWIDGVRQEGDPSLTHDKLPQLADNGAKIAVPDIQREPVACTWDAGAGANTSVRVAENWVGDELPNLGDGTADATFATAGEAATLDADAKFYGFHFDGAATEFAVTGDGAATLYGGTISATASRTGTVDVAVTLKKDLTVDVAAGATVDLSKDVREADGFSYGLTKTGAGELVLRGENAFSGNVNINGGKISVYSAKDGLVKEGATGKITGSEANGALDFHGAEVAAQINWTPVSGSERKLRFMSGRNVFKGKFALSSYWQFRPYINGGTTNVFEGGYDCAQCYQEWKSGAREENRAEMIFRNKPITCTASSLYLSVPGFTTLRLQVASNLVTKLNFAGDNGIISCEVPYAFKKTVDIGFPGSYSNYAKMELNGNDQEFGNLELSSGQYDNRFATFTSSSPATFAYNQTGLTTNTVVTFAGQIDLVQKGTAKGRVVFACDYNSKGAMTIQGGTIGFTGAAKAPNVTNVTVGAGAKLAVVRKGTFPKTVTLDLAEGDSVVDLADGAELRCAEMTIGGTLCEAGTWGSSASPAQHKDDVHFSGTGVVKTGKFGMAIIVR